MVVSDLTQDWWSVLVSSVKKGWDILHKQDNCIDLMCLEHEQWQSCVKTCGDWSGLQLHFILHCCSVSMQHQGAAVTMLQSVNTAGIITGCRLRLMMAALGSPEKYCQAHDNIWEERMARSKSWRWTWMRVGSKDFFARGQFFGFGFHMNDQEWSAYQILQQGVSPGALQCAHFIAAVLQAAKLMLLQHSLLNPGKRYGAGPRGIFINVHPGMDFSPPGSSCLIKSLVFLSARADWEERLVLTIRGTPIICRTFQESSKNSSHSQ